MMGFIMFLSIIGTGAALCCGVGIAEWGDCNEDCRGWIITLGITALAVFYFLGLLMRSHLS